MSPLTHDTLLFDTDEMFVDTLVPFLEAGVADAAPTAAATTEHGIQLLRGQLSARAVSSVTFFRNEDVYVRPAATIEAWYQQLRTRADDASGPCRFVGEVRFGATSASHRSWARYESVINDVFADLNAWLVCPYDVRELAPEVVDGAARTHPTIRKDGARSRSHRYERPERFLETTRELPIARWGAPTLAMSVNGDPRPARGALHEVARSAPSPDRAADLVLAANELVTNTIVHGGGDATVRAWSSPGEVVVDVTDGGPGVRDPLAGYRPPELGAASGMGLWVVRQLVDAFAADSSEAGTVVSIAVRD
jgi:anti-sigma regulatory factor (Ser/Thr protein kinase)